jgi:hypothetical protein
VRRTAGRRSPQDFAHEPPIQVISPEAAKRDIHVRHLATATTLMRWYRMDAITPYEVIDVLNAAGVRFLLAGAHGVSGWTNQPRATVDVDVMVATRHLRAAVRALRAAFPHLRVIDTPVVVRFRRPDNDEVILDVMKPNQPLHQVAMRYAHKIETAERTYFIPSLELALALKFAAMVSPRRLDTKKMIDGADFITIVRANPTINLAKLARLGERVYPGGAAEIVEMVRRVRAGERLDL